MRDVQSELDERNIPLLKVGVSDITYPIRVMDRADGYQTTVSKISMFVNLPHEFRGTHMSRFVEVLNRHRTNMTLSNLEAILDEMKVSLNAQTAHIEVRFPYFILKEAPVSKIASFMDYECVFFGSKGETFDFLLEVNVPVHSLCPCSKEISDFGAHNQRGNVKIQVRMKRLIWIEEIVEVAEKSASAPLYSLLKREDEKYVTEKAYMNPKFVEDIVRDVSIELAKDERITYYSVEAKNFESIHNHNAYAFTEFDRRNL
ncbi:MAG: GTP cyclohydrolase FolE2 [Caldisericaceae bacterium]